MTRSAFVSLGFLCVSLAASATCAHACVSAEHDWVLFQLSADFDDAFAQAARAHLAAELEPRGVAVCTQPPPETVRAALARVYVQGTHDGQAVLRIEDDVTSTTVERKIDFSTVPVEGRALTFGLAADELLGVGWASAVAKRAAQPTTVTATAAEPARASTYQVGVVFDASTYSGGPTLAGPALVVAKLQGRWLPQLRFGMRYGPPIAAPHGEIAFRDLHAALAGSWFITPVRSRWRVGPTVSAELLRVDVRGHGDTGASARQGQSWATVAAAGVAAAFRVSHAVMISARLCGGYVLVPVRGADAGQSVGGVESFVAQASLGMGVTF